MSSGEGQLAEPRQHSQARQRNAGVAATEGPGNARQLRAIFADDDVVVDVAERSETGADAAERPERGEIESEARPEARIEPRNEIRQ